MLVFFKKGLRFLNNHVKQWNTFTTDSHFILKTLEGVAFATGRSLVYPHTAAQHTGGNSGYSGPTRLATMEVRGRQPSIAKCARMGGC